VSLAIKDLLKYEVIQVVGKGHRRKILFQSNPDLVKVITQVLRMRERKMLAQIMSSYKNLKKMNVDDSASCVLSIDKTCELGNMIEAAELSLDALISSDLNVKF
jgi:DNA-binding transcriptional regulator GbsR (MarR family)